jgi:hypothetical protein
MNVNRDLNMQMLGKTGEAIVRNLLVDYGFSVKDSFDQYDSDKDFIATKNNVTYTVEVKTEQPYVLKNMVTFRQTQLRKCMSVDMLFFVISDPVIVSNYQYANKIFLSRPQVEPPLYSKYTTKQNIEMVGFKIHQPALKYIADLTGDQITALNRYAMSDYKRGYLNAM